MDIKTEIKKYKSNVKDLPLWFKYVRDIFAILGVFASILVAGWSIYLSVNNQEGAQTTNTFGNATSTISLSDIFAKANALDTILERQDFLKRYIGSEIYAKDIITQVSRSGNGGYIIDLIVEGQLISCRLDGSDENERKVPLLKGKRVSLFGTFSFSSIFGHGIAIDGCKI